eukprot:3080735-Heterocapsa_arctica.AAC.1
MVAVPRGWDAARVKRRDGRSPGCRGNVGEVHGVDPGAEGPPGHSGHSVWHDEGGHGAAGKPGRGVERRGG